MRRWPIPQSWGPTRSGDTRGSDGLAAEWTDTLGAHNVKYSEYNPAVLAFHEAHVEAAEAGLHKITVTDQVGCEIDYWVTATINLAFAW